MKCTITATEPSILRDAKPGQLFMLWDSRERECVFALLDPATPYRSTTSGEISLFKIVVIACRVDEGEPGYHAPGTQLWMSADIQIQFVEQVEPARFRERGYFKRADVSFGVAEGRLAIDFRVELPPSIVAQLRNSPQAEPLKPGDQL